MKMFDIADDICCVIEIARAKKWAVANASAQVDEQPRARP